MKVQKFIYKWHLPWMVRLWMAGWRFSAVVWLGWIGIGLNFFYPEETVCRAFSGESYTMATTRTGLTLLYKPNRAYVPMAVSYFGYAMIGRQSEVSPKWDGRSSKWILEVI